jgi:hypothetical protein
VEKGEYQRILAGDYARRDGDSEVSPVDDLLSSLRSYRQSYRESNDPLVRLFRGLSEEVGNGTASAWDKIKTALNGER